MKRSKKTYRFVIANDNTADLYLYASIVTACNHTVIEFAKNGKELIALAEEHQPDIILCDLIMPKMNGIEACSQIKKISPNTVCIITSAFAEIKNCYKSAFHKLNGFLFSPITVHKLNLCLNQIINQNQFYVDLTYRKDFFDSIKNISTELDKLANLTKLTELTELAEIAEYTDPPELAELNKDATAHDIVLHNGKHIKINDRHILLVSAIYHSLGRDKIADSLNITEQTVDTSVKRLKHNLSVEDRIQLIKLFGEWGYVRENIEY